MIHRLAAWYRSLSVLLRVIVVTSDFKKFYVTISCNEEQIIGLYESS